MALNEDLANIQHQKPSEVLLGPADEAFFSEDDLPSRDVSRPFDGHPGASPALSISVDFRRLVELLVEQHIREVAEAQREPSEEITASVPLGSKRNSASELMCQQHMGKEVEAGSILSLGFHGSRRLCSSLFSIDSSSN